MKTAAYWRLFISPHHAHHPATTALTAHTKAMPTFNHICIQQNLLTPSPINIHRRSDIHRKNQNVEFTQDRKQIATHILYNVLASIHIPIAYLTARYLKYLACLTTSGAHSISPMFRRKISAHDTAPWLLGTCCRISHTARYPPADCRYSSTA